MLQTLPVLNSRFTDLGAFRSRAGAHYSLLPLRFIELDAARYVLTNLVGEHIVLPKDTAHRFLRHGLEIDSPVYNQLKSRHFLIDTDSQVAVDLLSVKYRTRQSQLADLTSLFMFVVTLRCEHSCPYCQVSRQSTDRMKYDLQWENAQRAIDFIFSSPSPTIKIEFQGGEPLLNFALVKQIIQAVENRNELEKRDLQFVIATNLAMLTEEVLEFLRDHSVLVSTSLDGPRTLHNGNRPRPQGDSYELATSGIRRIRDALGADRIAALMTTTEASLDQPREIIDEYVRQGFSCIFLRPLSPYGFAVKTGQMSKYTIEQWLTFYRAALAYIIELNQNGIPFREEYSSLILRKILTSFPTSYVDLQSPAGIGISALVFNYDGGIYASDESRMLAETGDESFRLGHLSRDTFESVMNSDRLSDVLSQTLTECMPMCADCGFQPYCGSDPVFHHATMGDIVGSKPSSAFCRKNMEIMKHLIRILEEGGAAADVLKSWV